MESQDDPNLRYPDEESAENEPESDFARGRAETDPHKHGRFSTGEEELPDTPEKDHEGSFGDSDERDSTSE
jgi:hypothetical protein